MLQPLNLTFRDVQTARIHHTYYLVSVRFRRPRRRRRKKPTLTTHNQARPKSAETLIDRDVTPTTAGDYTSAHPVSDNFHMSNVPKRGPAMENSTLDPEFWYKHLHDHPDQELFNTIMEYITMGVPIGYKGIPESRISSNWPSAEEHSTAVYDIILDYKSKGRLSGPFSAPPEGSVPYVASPVGAFKKRRSQKVRPIHDLSWPPSSSINDGISPEEFTFKYATIDDAVQLVSMFKEPHMAKSDLSQAFSHIFVRPTDRPLLGFTWPNPETGKTEYWYSNVLPFGLRSSPKLFDTIAQGLEYMCISLGASPATLHYLDDFFTVDEGATRCDKSLAIINDTGEKAGFGIQYTKNAKGRILEFLGIIFDTIKWELRISEERMADIIEELLKWQGKKVCTKRELLSLTGKLTFCSKVVKGGVTFVRRLIHQAKKVKYLHYKVKLNKEAQADISWWIRCLPTHNGICMFPKPRDYDKEVHIFTDASDKGISAVNDTAWSMLPLTGKYEWMTNQTIAWREMYAVLLCLATFDNELSDKEVCFHIDNMAICHCISNGYCKEPSIMALIRAFYYYTEICHIRYRTEYINTEDNTSADALSRLDFDTFYKVHPHAQQLMSEPVLPIIDF